MSKQSEHTSDGTTSNPSKLVCKKCKQTYTYQTLGSFGCLGYPTDVNQATDDTQKAPTRTLSEQHAQHGTATSPIISDTNQASEDELRAELAQYLESTYQDGAVMATRPNSRYYKRVDEFTDKLLALIRTEKLKLLAEVRERVVGEHKPKTRGLTQNPNNAAYWTKASKAEFDLIEQQLNNLDKLEAEL